MAMGRFTARLTWNICSSMSRLGFSRSIRMTSGSTAYTRASRCAVSSMRPDMTSLAQAFLENRGAHGIRVDNDDFEGRVHGPGPAFKAHARDGTLLFLFINQSIRHCALALRIW